MNICCSHCKYCTVNDKNCYCTHPEQKYIYEYHEKHNVKTQPALIGILKGIDYIFPIKTHPRWCPALKQKHVLCEDCIYSRIQEVKSKKKETFIFCIRNNSMLVEQIITCKDYENVDDFIAWNELRGDENEDIK